MNSTETAADGASELGVLISHGSRREAQAARLVISGAEKLFGEGRAAEALAELESLEARFPLQKTEVVRAQGRVRKWEQEADEVEQDLDLAIAAYSANPSRVIFDSLVNRVTKLAASYKGTPKASEIDAKAAELRRRRVSADKGALQAKNAELLERAKQHFSKQELGLAELYLRLLLQSTKEGAAVRFDTENLLKRIQTRKTAAREVLLGS